MNISCDNCTNQRGKLKVKKGVLMMSSFKEECFTGKIKPHNSPYISRADNRSPWRLQDIASQCQNYKEDEVMGGLTLELINIALTLKEANNV